MLLNVEKFNEDLKICFDREVFQIFLPCGHSICCNKCAMGLQMCPICRENIKKTQTILQSRDSSILQSFKSSWNLKMFVVKWLKHSLGFLLFKSDLQRRMELFVECKALKRRQLYYTSLDLNFLPFFLSSPIVCVAYERTRF